MDCKGYIQPQRWTVKDISCHIGGLERIYPATTVEWKGYILPQRWTGKDISCHNGRLERIYPATTVD
jgi:hypothetical protein